MASDLKRGGIRRGGIRGGGSGGFRKGYAKKRSPEEGNDAPRANKRSKVENGEEEEEEEVDTPVVPRLQTDEDSNPFVALNHSGKRRVTISDFKGMTLVSIREYWVNDAGELKPGKKGISLPIEQYNALLAAAPLLESILSKKDIQITRPDYEAALNTAEAADDHRKEEQPVATADDDEEDEEE